MPPQPTSTGSVRTNFNFPQEGKVAVMNPSCSHFSWCRCRRNRQRRRFVHPGLPASFCCQGCCWVLLARGFPSLRTHALFLFSLGAVNFSRLLFASCFFVPVGGGWRRSTGREGVCRWRGRGHRGGGGGSRRGGKRQRPVRWGPRRPGWLGGGNGRLGWGNARGHASGRDARDVPEDDEGARESF